MSVAATINEFGRDLVHFVTNPVQYAFRGVGRSREPPSAVNVTTEAVDGPTRTLSSLSLLDGRDGGATCAESPKSLGRYEHEDEDGQEKGEKGQRGPPEGGRGGGSLSSVELGGDPAPTADKQGSTSQTEEVATSSTTRVRHPDDSDEEGALADERAEEESYGPDRALAGGVIPADLDRVDLDTGVSSSASDSGQVGSGPDASLSSLERRSRHLSISLSQFNRRATLYLAPDAQVEGLLLSTASFRDDLSVSTIHADANWPRAIEAGFEEELRGVEREVDELVEELRAESNTAEQEKQSDPVDERLKPTLAAGEGGEGPEWSWFRAQDRPKDFDRVKWSAREGTNAEDFCQACEGLIRLVAVTGDGTNVRRQKIRTRTAQAGVSTLEQLLAIESNHRRKIATDAIDWLLLVLSFGTRAFEMNLESTDREELSVSFTRAWDQEYYKYFNVFVRPLFKILMKACPARTTVYAKLGAPTRVVEGDFRAWLRGVELVTTRIRAWEDDADDRKQGRGKRGSGKAG
ncbi:hypothetical protein JCM11491_002826 [Sporobolomyces phaffii]